MPFFLSRQYSILKRTLLRVPIACLLATYWGIAELIRLVPPRPSATSVLVLRLDAIGDFVLWLSAGVQDVSKYARSRGHSVLLAKQDWADLARGLGIFDDVWPLDTQRFIANPLYRFAMLFKLRRAGFALVIQPRAAREFLLEDMIVRAVGAPEAIGNAGASNVQFQLKCLSDRWYSRLIASPPRSAHELERNEVFTRALTGSAPTPIIMKFEFGFSKQFGIEDVFFVIAPGAGWSGRHWPVARFAEVASRLQQEKGWMCVVVGGVQDHMLGESIRKTVGKRCINLAGRLTLFELGGILESAELVIANESMAAHYAPFVGTKAVVILGGGHFGRFMPYGANWPEAKRPLPVFKAMDCFGCNWKCRFSVPTGAPMPCIEQIQVDDVWLAVQARLREPDC